MQPPLPQHDVISRLASGANPANSTGNWGGLLRASGVATSAAQAVDAQNVGGNQAPPTVAVNSSAGIDGTVAGPPRRTVMGDFAAVRPRWSWNLSCAIIAL